MTYKLEISKKAKKFIKTLSRHEALKIIEVIDSLAEDPRPRWIEKLKGIKKGDYYRTSWGNYRVLYSVQDNILLVSVIDVDGRDDS